LARTVFDRDGQPVELGDHHYRASRYSVDVTVTADVTVRER
jgi:DNA-binding GntR family transcriptional regulator